MKILIQPTTRLDGAIITIVNDSSSVFSVVATNDEILEVANELTRYLVSVNESLLDSMPKA